MKRKTLKNKIIWKKNVSVNHIFGKDIIPYENMVYIAFYKNKPICELKKQMYSNDFSMLKLNTNKYVQYDYNNLYDNNNPYHYFLDLVKDKQQGYYANVHDIRQYLENKKRFDANSIVIEKLIRQNKLKRILK